LNSLPEVRSFIDDDLPFYPNVNIKYIPGADPEMLFFDANNKEVKKVEVTEKSRKEINDLLESHNFKKQAERIEKEPQYEEEDEDLPHEQELGEMPPDNEMEGEMGGLEDSVDADEAHEQAPGEERMDSSEQPTYKPTDEL